MTGATAGQYTPGWGGRRVRLPIAPRAQTGFLYAPGVPAPPAMPPAEALAWLAAMRAQGTPVETVEVGGPGDPLAEPEASLLTLRLLRQRYPELRLGLLTFGLGGALQAASLAEIGVNEVTIYVDAVEAGVAAKLYAWIRPGTRTLPLPQAIPLLIREQARSVIAFVKAGLEVIIQTTVYPGVNDAHVGEIAETMAGLGAGSIRILPCTPPGNIPDEVDETLISRVCLQAGQHLPVKEMQVAEEVGRPQAASPAGTPGPGDPSPGPGRPNLAVVSATGLELDLHLGQAEKILIYGPGNDGFLCLRESRLLPASGGGGGRWENLAATLPDCFALLVLQAGESPREILGRHGIRVLLAAGGVAETVDRLYGSNHHKKNNRC